MAPTNESPGSEAEASGAAPPEDRAVIKSLSHIAIAVHDLEQAKETFAKLGLEQSHEEVIDRMKVRVACFPMENIVIELVEAISEDSPVERFLEKRGEGVHHLCFTVDKIEDSLKTARERGIDVLDEEPRRGAEGRRVAFLHPDSTHGALIELCDEC
jgi:methylmalonyl-CoA/ethylmalonyl-CoA epimerase